MRILAVTHGPTVQPELFGDLIVEAGHDLVEWKIGEAPRPGGTFDAALVLGGVQNVGEEERFPWLEEEYDLLRELVAERTRSGCRRATPPRRLHSPQGVVHAIRPSSSDRDPADHADQAGA